MFDKVRSQQLKTVIEHSNEKSNLYFGKKDLDDLTRYFLLPPCVNRTSGSFVFVNVKFDI